MRTPADNMTDTEVALVLAHLLASPSGPLAKLPAPIQMPLRDALTASHEFGFTQHRIEARAFISALEALVAALAAALTNTTGGV